ncbi:MAG: fluoride efflux transporter CrcB [Planctomycetota bacterium]|nr:fluoride efflux transporter CrcB [Planctomycetota bacterium]
MNILLIFLAGGLGSLSRYGLDALVRLAYRGDFPLGTLAVNALGCFLFGLVQGWVAKGDWLSPQQSLILCVGFLGAFTTFSTFAAEGEAMIRESGWTPMLGYVLLQNVVGVAFVILGLRLVR